MVVDLRIRTNMEKWARDFDKKLNRFATTMAKEPENVAKQAHQFAKAIAPKDTGSLIQALRWRNEKKQKNGRSSAVLIVRSRANPRGGKTTDRYARIHHKTPRGSRYHPKTGDPHFLFTTRDVFKKRFGQRVKLIRKNEFIG